MVKKSINSILKEVLEKINPSKEEIREIENYLKEILNYLKKEIKKNKLNAEIFIGGSFAKKTLIKKNKYDIDIFLRFDKKHKEKGFSNLTEKILKNLKKKFKVSKIHGSRDYFKIDINEKLFFELIPVLKIKKPEEAENTTDLSYSHVVYAKKKFKSQKLLDDIKIVKSFCHANNSYGAESYVNGFSGYSLELLIYKYGSFVKFLKAMTKVKIGKKEVIDIEKFHKNKKTVLLDLNSSKLGSPVVLIDPTYKNRNTLAALNEETFVKFQIAAKRFLKNPAKKDFEVEKIDFSKKEENSKKKKLDFISLNLKTEKQEGDVAGSKLLKFYKHLEMEIGKYFEIKDKGFEYFGEGNIGKAFFSGKGKKEILLSGPSVKQEKHVKAFKKKHKKNFIKKGKVYSKKKLRKSLKEFLGDWEKINKRKMKEMSIVGFS